MATGNLFSYSDLYKLYDVVQSTHTAVLKQLIVAQLRDYFAADSFYRYLADEYGFPKTVDLTDKPSDAGMNGDDSSTRLFIGEAYRFEGSFFPAILIKNGSIKYKPLSINRERETVSYEKIVISDGYNSKVISVPKSFIFSGFWEGDIQIAVETKSVRSRDDLVDLIMLLFTDIRFRDMESSGAVITGVSAGAPSERDDRNEKLYIQTISLNILSQWTREIPILHTVDAINFCVDFAGNLNETPLQIAPNLTISGQIDLLTGILNL
jgi:hypothetical protein